MKQHPWTVFGGLGPVDKTTNNTEIAVRYDAEARHSFINQGALMTARRAF